MALRLLAVLALLLTLGGCGEPVPRLPALGPEAVILAFGDSLTRGTGAGPGEDYPSLLAGQSGLAVVNAGVPGEETAAGLARLPEVLADVAPDLVILTHGGNDLLRKRDPEGIKANLAAMVQQARESGAAVMLVGVPRPAIFLSTHPFYPDLAAELGVPLEPGALADILSDSGLRADPIHPNAAGYARLAEHLLQLLRETGAL
jgi:lysophospholipase L1-like esterase